MNLHSLCRQALTFGQSARVVILRFSGRGVFPTSLGEPDRPAKLGSLEIGLVARYFNVNLFTFIRCLGLVRNMGPSIVFFLIKVKMLSAASPSF